MAATGPHYAFDNFDLDVDSGELRYNGVPRDLDPTPFRLLTYLVRNHDRSVPKHELLCRVWPDAIVSDTALSSALKDVRKSLGDDGHAQRFVRTLRGRGYRFVPAVRALATGGAPPPGQVAVRAIAVLPFATLGAEAEGDYLADGVTEDIITQLAKVGDLSVVSRLTSSRFDPTAESLPEIAEALGVDTLLTGSVRRAGEHVRISARLIEAETHKVLWAETYNERIDDILRIQQEVAERIAAALQVKLSAAERQDLSQRPTQHVGAYDYYLRGRNLYRRWERTSNEAAIELYKRALELDPGFALAYAGLANAYGLRGTNFGHGDEWADAAIECARRAIELAGDLPEAHKALGLAHHCKGWRQKALDNYRQAVELRPGYDEAIYNVSQALFELGRWDGAVGWQKQRLQLDPTPELIGLATYAWYLRCLGFAEEAAHWFDTVLDERPLQIYANLWRAICDLSDGRVTEARSRVMRLLGVHPNLGDGLPLAGRVELLAGDHEAAATLFADSLRVSHERDIYARLSLGRLALVRGETEEGRRHLDVAEAKTRAALERGDDGCERRWELAAILASRGHLAEAATWFERAVDAGHLLHGWDVLEPAFEALRGDATFRLQLERMRETVAGMHERVKRERWHRLDGRDTKLTV